VRCAPDARRALLPAPLGGGWWAPLHAAQATPHVRAQALQAREGAEVEAWAVAQADEGSMRARCAEHATANRPRALSRRQGVLQPQDAQSGARVLGAPQAAHMSADSQLLMACWTLAREAYSLPGPWAVWTALSARVSMGSIIFGKGANNALHPGAPPLCI
jgi:hypothetical protein